MIIESFTLYKMSKHSCRKFIFCFNHKLLFMAYEFFVALFLFFKQMHCLKTDFDKWRDEDDSDVDDHDDFNIDEVSF